MIDTPRLRLFPCDDTLFDAMRMGDNVLSQALGANVPRKWTAFRDSFAPAGLRWKAHPPLRDWWVHLIVYRPDNLLIGSCGYKGEPDAEGKVEIGYEIRPSHRNLGLATEAARGLIDNAFTHADVRKVIAHTLPEESHSSQLLQTVGFVRTADFQDPDDGLVWRWELEHDAYLKRFIQPS
ncbi:GNAT family N-acetyltransferase [Salmonirosea aquatica]|uniref:GNAT family N-acetyltransferase n=1 Tax=Salmonirosea aquatica TaxID=2654236 RepID=A0A7C9FZ22_9BACT|nr:GNAT family N-acetyltransferase [Cytophagaceae bacterium SJW1-29]